MLLSPIALSFLVFLPALGGLAIWLFGRGREGLVKSIALGVTLVELSLAGFVFFSLGGSARGGFAYVERAPWIPALGAEYHLGVDGVSALLIALTSLLTLLALLASWRSMAGRARGYTAALLFLATGVSGAFAARDLLLFFVFWEFMLVPAYLLVGVCGGARRIPAAVKFFVFTTFGSLVMLVGLISLYLYHRALTGQATFDLEALASTRLPGDVQIGIFLAFALAFAIKTPIVPLHTWIADLYGEAPIASLLLITMMAKVGAYGFLRLNLPLFPDASVQLAPYLSVLAVAGILYGGLVAWTQRDLVRLLAYSSVAHLGFIVLGVFALNPTGASGAVLQMVNHGLSAGALFFVVSLIAARVGTTDLDRLGGMAGKYPILAGFFLVALFSAAGLPGLNGFVGEFLILLGAFQTQPLLAGLAALGVVVSAIYLLAMYRRAMHGSPSAAVAAATAPDLTRRELTVLVPLVALIVLIGLYPAPFLGRIDGAMAVRTAASGRNAALVTIVRSSAENAGREARPILADHFSVTRDSHPSDADGRIAAVLSDGGPR